MYQFLPILKLWLMPIPTYQFGDLSIADTDTWVC